MKGTESSSSAEPVARFRLPSGAAVARLGQGTWRMGEERRRRTAELAALRAGLDSGLALIDTAEMYGEGLAEDLVAEAIAGRRDQTFLVSKVYPHNATRRGTTAACERSLARLRTDYLDLYLLHWRGAVPLEETLEAFAALVRAGKIRSYGVSNLDTGELVDVRRLPGGAAVATDQVLYNPAHRGVEWDLLPWCRRHGMPVMAYSPLGSTGSGRRALFSSEAVRSIAARRGATPARVLLAFALRHEHVYVIPKAASAAHAEDNLGALALTLTAQDLADLDAEFPPPRRKSALDMI
jgi:diketogulonate reductase-like aldo/keto reductase